MGKSLSKQLLIKFDGESHQIDINTFIETLTGISNIIHEINSEFKSDKQIDIKVNAIKAGSFELLLELVEKFIDKTPDIFTKENLVLLKDLVLTLGGIFTIKQHLKSKKAKQIKEVKEGKVEIINNNGDALSINVQTLNIFKNANIQENLRSSFTAIEKEPKVTGLIIKDDEDNTVTDIKRNDFADMTVDVQIEDLPEEEKKSIIKEDVYLSIARLSFVDKK